MGIKVHNQGKVVVEWDDEDKLLLIMYPDGTVENSLTKGKAEKKAKDWFKKNVEKGCIGIGEIEWRNFPEDTKIVWSGELAEINIEDK